MQKNSETSTLALIENHPLTKQMREDQAAEVQRRRQAAADRLAKIEEEKNQILPELQRQVDEKRAEIAAIEKQSIKARETLEKLWAKKYGEGIRLDLAKNQQEAFLLECFDPEINRALEHFREVYEKLRSADIDEQVRAGRRNLLRLRQGYSLYSNQENVEVALKYCQNAIRELEAMKLLPSANYQRIERLKAEIPDFKELREYQLEKAMADETAIRQHG